MATDPAGPSHERYPALDTFRLLGALGVVVTHVAFQTGAYGYDLWGTALSRLDVGVAVFFVLSGFLLARPYLRAAEHARPAPATGRYLWRRAVRILPAYLVAVVVTLVVLPENAGASLRTWFTNLTLVALYTEERLPDGLTQMWSLATEVAFYAALPALAVIALGRRPSRLRPARVLLVLGVLVAVNVAWNLGLADTLTDAPTQMQWLPGHLAWFAAGIGLALVSVLVDRARPPRWASAVADAGSAPWTCWGLAAGVFLLASTPLAGPVDFTQVPTGGAMVTKTLLYTLIGALVVLPGVFLRPGTGFATVTTGSLARHLGRTSYALFCCHLTVLHLVRSWLDVPDFGGRTLLVLVLTLAVSLVVSELLYRWVELPATRLRNVRWPRRDRPRTSRPAQTSDTSTAS